MTTTTCRPSQFHVHSSILHSSILHSSFIHPSSIHPSFIHPSSIHPSFIHPSSIHPSFIYRYLFLHSIKLFFHLCPFIHFLTSSSNHVFYSIFLCCIPFSCMLLYSISLYCLLFHFIVSLHLLPCHSRYAGKDKALEDALRQTMSLESQVNSLQARLSDANAFKRQLEDELAVSGQGCDVFCLWWKIVVCG